MIKKNKEKAALAATKVVELAEGNMDAYEQKAKLIKEKQLIKEKERLEQIKIKEEEIKRR